MRRSVLPVRPDRVGSGGWVVAGLSLCLASLVAFAAALAALGGMASWQPEPQALFPLHLLTVGFLVPVVLTAITQLSAALFAGARTGVAAALLPVAGWLGGIAVAAGLARPAAIVPAGGTLLALATLGVVFVALHRMRAAPRVAADLRIGMLCGMAGLLATLGAGVAAGLSYGGVAPVVPPVAAHAALAASAAFVPLILAVSAQLFPMFARCPPLPSPAARVGPAVASLCGAVLLTAGVSAGSARAADGGALVSAVSIAAWWVLQERAYAGRRGRVRDPAAWGARVAAASLLACAWLAALGLVAGAPGGGAVAGGIALGLVGGAGGSVIAYLRRIAPFAVWNFLFQRLGRDAGVPKLDALRPNLSVEILPLAWAGGSAIAAWDASGAMRGLGPMAVGHALWPLAAAALLAVVELGWAPITGERALLRARGGRSLRPSAPEPGTGL